MTASILDGLPGSRARPQACAPDALRVAGRGADRQPRGARGGSGGVRQARAQSCIASCTSPECDDPAHRLCASATTVKLGGPWSRSTSVEPTVDPDDDDAPVALRDLVVITGFSGAGKSTALATFEDGGYFCVDNLPSEMISSLRRAFMHAGSKVEYAAVVSDVRAGNLFEGLASKLDQLRPTASATGSYSSRPTTTPCRPDTRQPVRRHPLAPTGASAEGIAREREILEPLRARADVIVDTGGLTAAMLRRKLAEQMLPSRTPGRLVMTVESFGFKYGTARDPDLMFDVRFLPNPHYEPELRPLTGLDDRSRRVHQPRRVPGRLLRAAVSVLGLSAAAVPCRGQDAPGDRDRLHRRQAPLRRDRRAPDRALSRSGRVPGRRGPPGHRQAGMIGRGGSRRLQFERLAGSASS